MSAIAKLVRTIQVPVDPATAFDAFTNEIGEWYRPGRHSWNDPDRAIGIRFEPGLGGRLLELYEDGEPFVMGRIVAWEPPKRLAFEWHSVFLPPTPLTEVEVRFEPAGEGTRVTLEHRKLDLVPEHVDGIFVRRAWGSFMQWFKEYVEGPP